MKLTKASKVRGWKVGQSINNRTKIGTEPQWNTVRQRYWKNRAKWAESNPSNFSSRDIQLMKRGNAPQRINVKTGKMESKELHHIPPRRDGDLFDVVEVWPEEHAQIDSHRHLGK